jgi:proline iminopeptidase
MFWIIVIIHFIRQSFGGIVAYEFLKKFYGLYPSNGQTACCLSVILSSTPTSIALVEQESKRLLHETLIQSQNQEHHLKQQGELFHALHVCRTKEIPKPLLSAREHAGSLWRGTTAIANYVAISPKALDSLPPALVLRGEFDFVTEKCVMGWKLIWPTGRIKFVLLENCAHHGLLEQETLYGQVVGSFCCEHDDDEAITMVK